MTKDERHELHTAIHCLNLAIWNLELGEIDLMIDRAEDAIRSAKVLRQIKSQLTWGVNRRY